VGKLIESNQPLTYREVEREEKEAVLRKSTVKKGKHLYGIRGEGVKDL